MGRAQLSAPLCHAEEKYTTKKVYFDAKSATVPIAEQWSDLGKQSQWATESELKFDFGWI